MFNARRDNSLLKVWSHHEKRINRGKIAGYIMLLVEEDLKDQALSKCYSIILGFLTKYLKYGRTEIIICLLLILKDAPSI